MSVVDASRNARPQRAGTWRARGDDEYMIGRADQPRERGYLMKILAEASTRTMRTGRSRPGDNMRWAELTVYWSDEDDGHYVVEAVRRSDVYHHSSTDCEAYEAYRIETVARDLVETDRPCYRCRPPRQDDLAPYEIVLTEVDRAEVLYTDSAAGVLVACLEMTGDGEHLTRLARRALAMASEDDDEIRELYTEAKRAERESDSELEVVS